MRKTLKKIAASIFSIVATSVIAVSAGSTALALDPSETIAWNKKLINGTSTYYWIDSGCDYTVSIPNAVSGFVNPSGFWNPLSLYQTTVQSSSLIDFYQVNSNTAGWANVLAATYTYRKDSGGNYYAMPSSEKNTYDWVYCDIKINDFYMCTSYYNNNYASLSSSITGGSVNAFRRKIIMHELGHVYGCKDLYNSGNTDSLMYAYGNIGTGIDMTADVDAVLDAKY